MDYNLYEYTVCLCTLLLLSDMYGTLFTFLLSTQDV